MGKVDAVVCAGFCWLKFALWWEEVSFFSSGGQGCMRYFCLLIIWFVFVLFIVGVRHPALGAAS